MGLFLLQAEPAVFNKASLMNVAFEVALSLDSYDCFIFHDVDMLPEDDRNFYTCSSVPRHVGSHLNKWDYKCVFYFVMCVHCAAYNLKL
jgi:hypothetical protein